MTGRAILQRAWRAIGLACLVVFGGSTLASAAPSITRLDLLSGRRIDRTVFEYVFQVTIQNPDRAVSSFRATAIGAGTGTTILDGRVETGAIGAGETVVANDTITLRHDRRFQFQPAALSWSPSYFVANTAPIADAGPSQLVFVGDFVGVDGFASFDQEGSPLSYFWVISGRPPGSLASLDLPSSMQPHFVPDLEGTYELTLLVHDGDLASAPATTQVVAQAVDPNPPSIVTTYPANFATEVAPETSVVATFTELIDPNSVDVPAPQIRIFGDEGVVPAQIFVSGHDVVVQPDSPLTLGGSYFVTVSFGRIADLQGQVLEDVYEWEFTVRAPPQPADTTRPGIVSTTPAAGATGVVLDRTGSIAVDFSEPIDAGSVASAFRLVRADGLNVPVQVALTSATRAVVTPGLRGIAWEGQRWTATITTALRDRAGNALASNYAWSFDALLPHATRWLSKPAGIGSPGDTDAYYASLPFQNECDWDWDIALDPFWTCGGRGAPNLLTDWLWDMGWSPARENRAVFYDAGDLATGRNARCFFGGTPADVPGGRSQSQHVGISLPGDDANGVEVACWVGNHGPTPGSPGHPDPTRALTEAVDGSNPSSISAIVAQSGPSSQVKSMTVTEASGFAFVTTLERGDVVIVGAPTGSIAPGNLFWATSGPAGVGVPCSSNFVDPQPCPMEGGPLYGLLMNTKSIRLASGATASGFRPVGTGLSFTALERGSLELKINDTAPNNGSGSYSVQITVQRANKVSFMVYKRDSAGKYRLSRTAELDGEGPKAVPQACISCHGGTWNAETHSVTGASLLPIDPSRMAYPTTAGWTRTDQEEAIRRLNFKVMTSQSNRPVASPTTIESWILGTYGLPVANDNYLPPGWSADATLYRQVVKPYCQSCHQALSPALDFDSAAEFRAFSASIRNDVCTTRIMPHAGPTFEQFWQSSAPTVLRTTVLGGAACP